MDIKKIGAFLLANAVGFFSVGICYFIGMHTEQIQSGAADFNPAHFEQRFLVGTILLWIVCALLSCLYFLIESDKRLVFLWAPAILPLAYGLAVVFTS
jgi:hypothetical protein